MPRAFDLCVKNGGKVRTQKVGSKKYRHVCILKGKVFKGYVKTKKSGNKFTSALKKG